MVRRTFLAFLLLMLPACRLAAQSSQTSPAAAKLSTPDRINGYRGIWFTLGQFYGPGEDGEAYAKASRKPVFPYGDKYSGGLGTYTAKHTPLAIYCPEVEKTFFVYGGTPSADSRHLLCMISYFDHRTQRVPRPVIVHDKQGVDDPHDNPSLAVDDNGYLWVFISGRARARPGFKYRSLKPYSIDGFERISEEEFTYPQPHHLEEVGFLHLFTKYTGVRELYWEHSDDGRIWSQDRRLAGIRESGDARGGHYQTSARRGSRVGTFFNRHPNGNVDRRTDIYYLQTEDRGKTWTTVDGRVVQPPLVDVDNPARVLDYASQRQNVYLKDMAFDREGFPVLLYVTSSGHEPGPPNDPRYFTLVQWDGAAWKTIRICRTDHNYDMGCLFIEGDAWSVWVPSEPGPQPGHSGGSLAVWTSRDHGATWRRSLRLTGDSSRNQNYVRQPLNWKDPFRVFWADGDPTQLSESHLFFADSNGGIWELPYVMEDDEAEPKRIPLRLER